MTNDTQFSSILLGNAVKEFSKLPGIGKRTALRLALHLLRQSKEDVENFGQQYKGLYHVLGGVISPMDGIGPADLAIDQLIQRAETGNIKEIILALSPTMEGDTTNFYLYKKLAKFAIEISTIAKGVSIGNELEYADEITLGRSIINRTPYKIN